MTCRPVISGQKYMIAAGHPLASMAGTEIFKAGGNAIDAGVAAGIALSVLESELVSFAGVAPILLYSAEADKVVTIPGLGCWPKAVDAEFFNREHSGEMPNGILRTVVPAAPDAWITALANYGRMGFADVAQFAIEFALKGFPTYPLLAELIEDHAEEFGRFPHNRDIYFPNGKPPAVGSLFKQEALGRTIQYMADEDRTAAAKGGRKAGLAAARAAFYAGDIAQEIIRFQQENGGLLREEDLRNFHVGIEPSVHVPFGDWQMHGCGPWTQGPMLLQIMSILDGYDLASLGHNSAEYLHVLAEAIRLAAADRDRYYGDPNFVDVPLERLLSREHADALRGQISPDRAGWETQGDSSAQPAPGGHMDTSYVCAVDASGNAFSATPSDAAYNAPIMPKLGFVASPRGTQSWTNSAHPSSVAPGKRPRLTPNPALAVKDGRFIPFGSPGGDVQTQAMVQTIVNHLVFGFDVQAATEAPRLASYSFPSSFHPHKSSPGLLKIEATLCGKVGAALRNKGHRVEEWPDYVWLAGSVSLIDFDAEAGRMDAGSDPRRMGYAIGW